MSAYLLVGEAPSQDLSCKNLEMVLACKSVRRVPSTMQSIEWLGAEHGWLLNFVLATTHVNLLPGYPGPGKRGSEFPLVRGREEAELFMQRLREPSIVTAVGSLHEFSERFFPSPTLILLAGRRVARAFRLWTPTYLEETQVVGIGVPVVVVPHPSGVNRWWNDRGNANQAKKFLERLGEDTRCSD